MSIYLTREQNIFLIDIEMIRLIRLLSAIKNVLYFLRNDFTYEQTHLHAQKSFLPPQISDEFSMSVYMDTFGLLIPSSRVFLYWGEGVLIISPHILWFFFIDKEIYWQFDFRNL